MQTISFASKVKEELCANPYTSSAVKTAILSGFVRETGVITIRNKSVFLTIKSENAKIAKFIYSLLLEHKNIKSHLSFSKKGNSKKNTYLITIEGDVDKFLLDIGVNFLEGKISKEIVFDDETIAGYLLGCFLSCGSVNSPETSNYHLELSINNENHAKWISHLFGRYKNSNIEPKIVSRRDKYVLYFKRSDQIADFLVMIGAMGAVMEFEEVRIGRDFMNNTNRLLNLDTANMDKTISAGARQLKEINFLESKGEISTLKNDKINLLIKYRKLYPSASLDELAEYLSKELGSQITKSNVNHLFRKLHEMYLKRN